MEIIIGREPEDLQLPEAMGSLEEMENIVRRAVEITGPLYDVENSEVSVTLTNDEHIHSLNREYRGLDRPTDVLSFAFVDREEPEIEDGPETEVLGDIIISLERAWAQTREYGHSMERELSFLTRPLQVPLWIRVWRRLLRRKTVGRKKPQFFKSMPTRG